MFCYIYHLRTLILVGTTSMFNFSSRENDIFHLTSLLYVCIPLKLRTSKSSQGQGETIITSVNCSH